MGIFKEKHTCNLYNFPVFFSGLFHTLQSGRCLIEITTTLLQGDSKTLRPVHLICKSYHLFLFVVVVVVAKPKSLGFALQMFLTERIEVNKNSVDIGKKTWCSPQEVANSSFHKPTMSSGVKERTPSLWNKKSHELEKQLHVGVSKNSGTPKWMVIMEHPIKWMIWGYHHFRKPPCGNRQAWKCGSTFGEGVHPQLGGGVTTTWSYPQFAPEKLPSGLQKERIPSSKGLCFGSGTENLIFSQQKKSRRRKAMDGDLPPQSLKWFTWKWHQKE